MRVAVALHHLDLLGNLMGIIRSLRKQGHKVAVFNHTIMSNFQEFIPVRCQWMEGDLSPIEDFGPDAILMWNGRYWYLKQAAQKVRDRFPGKTRIVEFGWFPQRGNLTIANDVCHLSTMPRILESIAKKEPSQKAEDIVRNAAAFYGLPFKDESLPENYVFIPFQLEADTQIVECSPYIKKMDDLVSEVRKLVGPKVPIVYKQHPKCSTEGSGPIEVSDKDAIEYKGELNSVDLARGSICIAGINSTVLSEAMLLGVPGITLGTYNNGTFYYRLGPEGIINNMQGLEVTERGWDLIARLHEDFKADRVRRINGLAHVIRWQFSKDDVPDRVVYAVFHPDGMAGLKTL